MGEEKIVTGYCRVQDQSRMVAVEYKGSELLDCDCSYGGCLYQDSCPIGKAITELIKQNS